MNLDPPRHGRLENNASAPTVLIAVAFDSQVKWGASIRTALEARGCTCSIVMPDVRSALSQAQIVEAGVEAVEEVTWAEMMRRANASDIFVSALSGPYTKQISIESHRFFSQTGQQPPVLISGWVGVIIEKLVAGYLDRCASDVVAVNSKTDYDRFVAVAQNLGLPDGNLLLSGLPFIRNVARPQRTTTVRTVLFADQPTVPEAEIERLYTYNRLLDYARAHPDRRVLLRPRHRLGEETFHRMQFHPEHLLHGIELPPNFALDYTPISDHIADVDLLLTFSSTAAIEAIAAGSRVGLIMDLGVHERYGNQVFIDSGLLRTFDQLIADDVGTPRPKWLETSFPNVDRSAAEVIAERALELLSSGERPSREVWNTRYFDGVNRSYSAIASLRDGQRFQRRLRAYGPLRRAFVAAGDAILPHWAARPIDRLLQRLGIL